MRADPLLLLLAQIATSFLAFGLAARKLAPRLGALSRAQALEALLWVHAFRFVALGLLAPGQTAAAVPLAVSTTIASGDLASALLALLALLMLQQRAKAALAFVWLFSLVSVLDMVTALGVGLGNHVYRHPLGFSWYVLASYVPLLCVTQIMIVLRLLQRGRVGAAAAERLAQVGAP
jgi:hypothetical protein